MVRLNFVYTSYRSFAGFRTDSILYYSDIRKGNIRNWTIFVKGIPKEWNECKISLEQF